jgi:VanZ family protein
MTPERKNIWFSWSLVAGLCAAIFFQSCFASPGLGPAFPYQDKFLHMAAYGVLAALVYRACRLTWPNLLSPLFVLAMSIIFTTVYGLSDEYHQSFVTVRQADLWDLVADFLGSILGATGYFFADRSRRTKLF